MVDEAAAVGQRIQIQVLARDVIVATARPAGLSVRNVVAARVVSVTPDVGRAVLVELDIGRTATLLARITVARLTGAGAVAGQAGLGAHKGSLIARARVQRASALMTGWYSMVKPSAMTMATAASAKPTFRTSLSMHMMFSPLVSVVE